MKRVLCLFTGREGTTVLDHFLQKIDSVYKPGFEPLDLCHYKNEERSRIKNNMIDYIKFLYNIKNNLKKLDVSRLGSLNNISFAEYNKKVSNYDYIYFKLRYQFDLNKLDELKLDYIILPIRYDFEYILSLYVLKHCNNVENNLKQFNRKHVEDNESLYITQKLDINKLIYILTTDFDKYINNFKKKYLFFKEKKYNIFIYNYNEFKENNILVLNKVLKFLNIPEDNIIYNIQYKKKKFSYSLIFNQEDNNMIEILKKKYFDKKYNILDKFIKNIS